jgi:predicted nucleotidyltransferase
MKLKDIEPLHELFGPNMSALRSHSVLNPKIWTEDGALLPGFREQLLRITKEFLQSMRLPRDPVVKDIVITGSNANFNYSNTSDLDLHLIVDMKAFAGGNISHAMIKELLMAKQAQWRNNRHITFKGVPVEVFIEDLDTPPSAGGIFSVKHNRWKVDPTPVRISKRDPAVRALAVKWISLIKSAIKTNDPDVMRDVMGDIRAARKKALDGRPTGDMSGEAHPANLAFKVVRATGWLTKLNDAIDLRRDAQLSLESAMPQLNELFGPPGIKYASTFNPALFNDDKLKPEVRDKMIMIAQEFERFIGVKIAVQDVVFKGSNANFNYTKSSDIDLHLIAPVKNPKDMELIEAKRAVWKNKYASVNILGYPVEIMVEEPGRVHSSSAVYSVTNDAWVSKPVYQKPTIDKVAINILAKKWLAQLRAAIETGSVKEISKVRGQIIGVRNKALDGSPGAEYKTENLAYKRIRDAGIFDTIAAILDKHKQDSLSLKKTPNFFGQQIQPA